MTTVDRETTLNKRSASAAEWINEAPCPLIFERLPSGQIELYIYCYGKRLSFTPTCPDDLWGWIDTFVDDHVKALSYIGLELPEERRERSATDMLKELETL